MTRLAHVISRLGRRHHSAYVSGDVKTTTGLSCPNNSPPTACPGKTSSGSPTPSQQMKECLGTVDLVSLGVGSCVGTGMYLTVGIVAATMAGPGGVVSFLLAGVVSMLTGLCYAELAGLCPKSSGSAYMYAYVTAGELAAFVIGWGLVVEYVIGTAAGASALSETLDSLCNGVFSAFLNPLAASVGLPKLDLVAAVICAALTLLLASGVEMSAKVNNALNVCNLLVLVVFVGASLFLGSARNWKARGFFPMGVTGVVRAIPTCYFAFIGFDALAATGAEAKSPSRTIPLSILLSIAISALTYALVILTLTFDLPFYLLPPHTAMTEVFPRVNFTPGKYVVAVGAVSGEFAATFGSLFPLPRVLMAMATDGLIFRQLAKICPKRHTPLTATVCSGLVATLMATFFRLTILIELVLAGTLLAYVSVTFALLHMRYVVPDQPKNPNSRDTFPPNSDLPLQMNDRSAGYSVKSSGIGLSDGLLGLSGLSSHQISNRSRFLNDEVSKASRKVSHQRRSESVEVTAPSKERTEREAITDSSPSSQRRSGKYPSMSRRGSLSLKNERRQSSSPYKEGKQSSASYKEGKQSSASYKEGRQSSSPYKEGRQSSPPYKEGRRSSPPYKEGRQSLPPYKHSLSEGSERGENNEHIERIGHDYELTYYSETSFKTEQTNVNKRKHHVSKSTSRRSEQSDIRTHESSRPLLEIDTENGFTKVEDDILFHKSSRIQNHRQKLVQRETQSSGTFQNDTTVINRFHFQQSAMGEKHNRPNAKTTFWLLLKAVDMIDYITAMSSSRVQSLLYAIYGMEVVLCVFMAKTWQTMADGSFFSLCILGVLSAMLCALVGVLTFLPETVKGNSFRAPLVPSLPLFVAMVNLYLMTSLSVVTWLLFGLWMSVGLLIYFLYCVLPSETSPSSSSSVSTTPPSTTIQLNEDNDDADDDDDHDDDDHDHDEQEQDETTVLLSK